jgi:hypothetical protein
MRGENMRLIKKSSDEYQKTRSAALEATFRDSPDRDAIKALMGKIDVVKLGDIGRLEILAAVGRLADRLEAERC